MRKPSPRPYLMNNLSEADRNYSAADRGPLTRYRWPHMQKMGSTHHHYDDWRLFARFGRFGSLGPLACPSQQRLDVFWAAFASFDLIAQLACTHHHPLTSSTDT